MAATLDGWLMVGSQVLTGYLVTRMELDRALKSQGQTHGATLSRTVSRSFDDQNFSSTDTGSQLPWIE